MARTSMPMPAAFLLAFTLLMIAAPRPAGGQAVAVAEVSGTISDPTGLILPSAEVIMTETGKQLTRSTLTDELASQVRTHLRTTQRGFAGSAGSPIFSVVPQQSVSSTPHNRTIPPAFPGRDREDNPGQQGQSRDPGRATGSGTSSDDDRSRRANATVHEQDALASQLAAQAAASALAAEWRAAGLGRHDRHIIEQCQRHGLTPQDGQTIASRLKNGESISSVRSRIAQAT